MTSTHAVLPHHHLVHIRLSGALNPDDLRQLRTAMLGDPAFRSDYDLLVDFGTSNVSALTAAHVRQLSTTTAFGPTSRRAAVASDDVAFGLARMFSMLRELETSETVQVFRTLKDALAWLGIDRLEP